MVSNLESTHAQLIIILTHPTNITINDVKTFYII